MPLQIPPPPTGAIVAVERSLEALGLAPPDIATKAFVAGPPAITTAAGHYVYEMKLDDVIAGAPLSAAYCVTFRYLLMQPVSRSHGAAARSVAAAEIPVTPDGQLDARDAQITTGPFVAATEAAIVAAEQDPLVHAREHEIRILRLPAIGVMALWLHPIGPGPDPAADRLIPLAPCPPPLVAGRPYEPTAFFQAVRTDAQTARDFAARRPG